MRRDEREVIACWFCFRFFSLFSLSEPILVMKKKKLAQLNRFNLGSFPFLIWVNDQGLKQ
ncbi:uncharacterized protein DS421_6g173610 [Arachis hypogaea]|nr:uncharacterized protein DS421_6g173610 [Arachis hypogaea]